jgi:hypothetical protein
LSDVLGRRARREGVRGRAERRSDWGCSGKWQGTKRSRENGFNGPNGKRGGRGGRITPHPCALAQSHRTGAARACARARRLRRTTASVPRRPSAPEPLRSARRPAVRAPPPCPSPRPPPTPPAAPAARPGAAVEDVVGDAARREGRDAACPISTRGGTKLVRLVRGRGGAAGRAEGRRGGGLYVVVVGSLE